MENKLFIFFLQLGTNMWDDVGDRPSYDSYTSRLVTSDEAWREVVDALPGFGFNAVLIDIGDAIRFDSHPEIAIEGAWSKEKVKAELAHMRKIGLLPLPKLNFSAGHDAWLKEYNRMLSTPKYYQVCEDLIKEVAELFDTPPLMHLGMDEEGANSSRSLNRIRQGELWWHDQYFFYGVCEKYGMRPWIWSDACRYDPEGYCQKMPKSVMQSNWCYRPVLREPDGSLTEPYYDVYFQLEKYGFDQIPTCSTVGRWCNPLEMMLLLKEKIAPERLKGFVTAPWNWITMASRYFSVNEASRFYYARKKVYPEWD